MPLFHSGKFRRYDQQPSNSAGNALWDLLSTRNTTIQVNVSYCSRHWENTALCKFFFRICLAFFKECKFIGAWAFSSEENLTHFQVFFPHNFHTQTLCARELPPSLKNSARLPDSSTFSTFTAACIHSGWTGYTQDTLRSRVLLAFLAFSTILHQEAPISAKMTPEITVESETRSQNIGIGGQSQHNDQKTFDFISLIFKSLQWIVFTLFPQQPSKFLRKTEVTLTATSQHSEFLVRKIPLVHNWMFCSNISSKKETNIKIYDLWSWKKI